MRKEQHPTKANGCATCDLLLLVEPVEDLKVSRVREGDFRPGILPWENSRGLPLTPKSLRLSEVTQGHVGSSQEYDAVVLDGPFRFFVDGKRWKNPWR